MEGSGEGRLERLMDMESSLFGYSCMLPSLMSSRPTSRSKCPLRRARRDVTLSFGDQGPLDLV